jgi:hypothetical protein
MLTSTIIVGRGNILIVWLFLFIQFILSAGNRVFAGSCSSFTAAAARAAVLSLPFLPAGLRPRGLETGF